MPAFVLPTVASTDLQVYKKVFGNHGKPQAALNATAAFFWGVGCFPQLTKP